LDRAFGVYGPAYWYLLFANVVVPQLFWFRRIRTNLLAMWIISIIINTGMWFERFVIIIQSLHHDFLPSIWRNYHPTWVDFGLLFGSMGLFGTLFLLFLRFIPAVALSEVKELQGELEHEGHLAAAEHAETVEA
jgi:molybdopterin-containing oxidoreductase family membrane subunit